MKRKKTLELVTVDELSEEDRNTVLDRYRYGLVDHESWSEGIIESWKGRMGKFGFHDIREVWDMSCRQGSGACFTGELDLLKWMGKVPGTAEEKRLFFDLLPYVEGGYLKASIVGNGNMNRYTHDKCADALVEFEDEPVLKAVTEKTLTEKRLRELEEMIEESRMYWCGELYSNLRDEFERLTSDEAIIEHMTEAEYLFRTDSLLREPADKNC